MIVFLNGRFVPEEQALVPVSDRAFLLGDGLYETLPLYGGRPFCWSLHLDRLLRGAALLGITLPCSVEALSQAALELIARNGLAEAVLRVTLTRGSGVRGFSPNQAGPPNLVMMLYPAPAVDAANPPRWRMVTGSARVPEGSPLSGCKHSSRLLHVMMRAEAESHGADEALLLNTSGAIAEAVSGNVFWIECDKVFTPPLAAGALPGITRRVILGVARQNGHGGLVRPLRPETLLASAGAFVTLSTLGVVEIAGVDEHSIPSSPLTAQLRAQYWTGVDDFRFRSDQRLEHLASLVPEE